MIYLGIFIGGIVGMFIGWIWYSKFMFGTAWNKLSGFDPASMTPEQKKNVSKTFAISFILEFVTAFVVMEMIRMTGTIGFLGGVELVLLLWIGLLVPIQFGAIIWKGKPWNMLFIAIFQDAVKLIILAAIFTLIFK